MTPLQLQQLLQASYQQATKKDGLVNFTESMRGTGAQYSVKRTDLDTLFRDKVWIYQSKPGGHQKWIHPITHVVVEYVDRESGIDPGAAKAVFEAVQKHLNILCNEIFCYTQSNWKKEPDYSSSVERFFSREKSLKR